MADGVDDEQRARSPPPRGDDAKRNSGPRSIASGREVQADSPPLSRADATSNNGLSTFCCSRSAECDAQCEEHGWLLCEVACIDGEGESQVGSNGAAVNIQQQGEFDIL